MFNAKIDQLLMPEDDEELALTLNGKKKKIKRLDFDTAMINSGIPKRAVENLWVRIERGSRKWSELIGNSFLQKENKEGLVKLLTLKQKQLK